MSGLFGLGQACSRRSTRRRAHDLAIKSSRARALSARRRAPTISAWPRRVFGLRFCQSGRHGGGFRQECARAAPASRHGLRLRRGGHADAARAKRQRQARAFSARSRTAPSSIGSASTMRGRRRRLPGCATGRRESSASISAPAATAKIASPITCRASSAWRRWRATSPSISLRPIRRACAISRRRRRSMCCSSACRPRASALRQQAAASGQARARPCRRRPARSGRRDRRATASTASSCRTPRLRAMGSSDAAFARETGGLSGRPLFARVDPDAGARLPAHAKASCR